MPETEARPRSKTATVARREASVPRHGTRRASLARITSRLANATKTQVRLSALRPPLFRDGREHRGHHPGAKTRRGKEEGCAVWHREFEACTASGVASQCVQPTPAAGCRRRRGCVRAECRAEPRACRRRRLSVNASAPCIFPVIYRCGPLEHLRARKGRALHSPGIRDPRSSRMLRDRATLALQHEERERPPMRIRTPRAGRRGDADCRPSACGAIRRSGRSRR